VTAAAKRDEQAWALVCKRWNGKVAVNGFLDAGTMTALEGVDGVTLYFGTREDLDTFVSQLSAADAARVKERP